eukprot:scaffold9354_cov192-Ochromonas_danica.AAC.3
MEEQEAMSFELLKSLGAEFLLTSAVNLISGLYNSCSEELHKMQETVEELESAISLANHH